MKKDAIRIDRAAIMVNKKAGNDQWSSTLAPIDTSSIETFEDKLGGRERDKLLFGLRTNIANGAYGVNPDALAERLIEASLRSVLRRKPVDFRY